MYIWNSQLKSNHEVRTKTEPGIHPSFSISNSVKFNLIIMIIVLTHGSISRGWLGRDE
jgi:hypothetical protein